jgi:RNA polymerase sigma-70 factor (ECF subfamily)
MKTEFEEIYERYARDVHRFALYLSGNAALAEDITSETFVRLWASEEKIRTLTVKAYLFAIARHLYIDSRRTASRYEEIDPELPEPVANPEMRAFYRSELREALHKLQQLSEVDRAALLMRAQQDLPYEEIARALGISLAAVKVKIHRARLKLAEPRATTVEEFFKQDPEFAGMAKGKRAEELLGIPPAAALKEDHERAALIRTKNLLQWRAHWLALALMFTVFPLSSVFSSKGLVWFMLRDAPIFAQMCWGIAVVCWIQFIRTRRRLRSSGM